MRIGRGLHVVSCVCSCMAASGSFTYCLPAATPPCAQSSCAQDYPGLLVKRQGFVREEKYGRDGLDVRIVRGEETCQC